MRNFNEEVNTYQVKIVKVMFSWMYVYITEGVYFIETKIWPQKVEKTTPKSRTLMAVGRFFSLQPRLPKTAQNFICFL